VFLTFSARTSANQTQDIIDAKMEKKRKVGHEGAPHPSIAMAAAALGFTIHFLALVAAASEAACSLSLFA